MFDFIRYANVWEDADILCEALAPSAKQGRILSISSSGDNVLALLTLDPQEIAAVDLSGPQLACLELRLAAFKELDHLGLCQFLGVLPIQNRIKIYSEKLKKHLSASAQTYWEGNLQTICGGIIHAGKFERYLKAFGKWVLPLIHSRKTIDALLKTKTREERIRFYTHRWDTWRWRLLFKVFFSRFVMGRAGRAPAFFDQVRGNVAERILERSRHALTEGQTDQNPFLHYILRGNFSQDDLPCYLRPENFDAIRSRVDRIQIFHGEADQIIQGPFDAFNLSDIFEYMDPDRFETCYKNILKIAKPGARIAYWNMLVERSCPASLRSEIVSLNEEASSLHAKDKAWFYQKFAIEQRVP